MKKIISVVITLALIFCLPSVVYGTVENTSETVLNVNTSAEVKVEAKAYLLMDSGTGTVLAAKNEHEKLYPASVTKIMTLLLVAEALENGKFTLETELTCSAYAAEKGGSQIWLEPGEIMTVGELLKAAVVYSANDACCLLGEAVSGDEAAFCALMNEKAVALGMQNTHFDNCTGLDDNTDTHKTTAYDIALMSRELLKHDIIKNYTSIWMDTLRNGETQIVNTNKLMRTYHGATGLKTGTTSKAGCCISATAERDGMELIAVVLGADNSKARFSGAAALLDYGFANYKTVIPVIEGCFPEKIKVNHGVNQDVCIVAAAPPSLLTDKSMQDNIEISVEISESIDAPVSKGQQVGKLLYSYKGTLLAESELLIGEDVYIMNMHNAVKALFFSLKY